MSLEIEVNVVYFPESCPPPREGEPDIPWTQELRQRVYHQQAEIHLISMGPVTQEILDSRLIDADLGGVNFSWNPETSEYTWMAKDGNKPLPLKYMSQLLTELRKVGFQTPQSWYTPESETTSQYAPFKKFIWHLEKKF